jgi:hypothetical protein
MEKRKIHVTPKRIGRLSIRFRAGGIEHPAIPGLLTKSGQRLHPFDDPVADGSKGATWGPAASPASRGPLHQP